MYTNLFILTSKTNILRSADWKEMLFWIIWKDSEAK